MEDVARIMDGGRGPYHGQGRSDEPTCLDLFGGYSMTKRTVRVRSYAAAHPERQEMTRFALPALNALSVRRESGSGAPTR